MGSDPVHLTDAALGTVAGQLCEMAEGNDAMFSSGKRALEDEEDRPAPIIQGRKPWVYGPSQGRGGRGGQGGWGGARGGFPSGGLRSQGLQQQWLWLWWLQQQWIWQQRLWEQKKVNFCLND